MSHLHIKFNDFLTEHKNNMNSEFWVWFGDSKVTDENQQPIIVYHGTKDMFDKFDIERVGYNSGNFGHYGYGFYFSDDVREAKTYGHNIFKCYLKITNPYTNTDAQIRELKKLGVGTIDDVEILNIQFESLIHEMTKIDSAAAKYLQYYKEFGYEDAFEKIVDEYGSYNKIPTLIDLNDLSDVVDYTDLKGYSDVIPEYVFDLLGEFGIDADKLEYTNGFKHSQSLHWITDLGKYSHEVTEAIKSLGYDGIIYGSEYIAFYPNQIKSIDNDGSWDMDDNNIFS